MADELSPAEEARLRRLLARARHDEQIPGDVAARLDGVLARLEAEDPIDEPLADVHELAARRRRKVVSVLVAAAAVVVVGIGLGQVVGTPDGGDQATTAESAGEVQADSAEGRTDRDEAAAGGAAGATADEAPEALSSLESGSAYLYDGTAAQKALGDLLVVRGRLAQVPDDERFSRSALRLQRQVAPRPAASRTGQDSVPLSMAARGVQRTWQGCSPIDYGDGTGVAVLYAGDPAVLVFRPPMGETQVVDLLQCGTGGLVRSVTLPAG